MLISNTVSYLLTNPTLSSPVRTDQEIALAAAVAAEPVPGRCCGGEQLQAADFDEGQPSCGFRGSLKGPSGRLKIVQSEACLLV